MENMNIFYGFMENFTAIWYISLSFRMYIVSRFGNFVPRKIWQPWSQNEAAWLPFLSR
jgi:hypothetical protein